MIESKIRGGKLGHVEDIVTHPEQRHKGIGEAVLTALYEVAHSKDCYKMVLQCQQHNVGFYEKCGYEVGGSAMRRLVTH